MGEQKSFDFYISRMESLIDIILTPINFTNLITVESRFSLYEHFKNLNRLENLREFNATEVYHSLYFETQKHEHLVKHEHFLCDQTRSDY